MLVAISVTVIVTVDWTILFFATALAGGVLDFNANKQVFGVDILNLFMRSPKLNQRELQFQTG
jgi:hypothetical protein